MVWLRQDNGYVSGVSLVVLTSALLLTGCGSSTKGTPSKPTTSVVRTTIAAATTLTTTTPTTSTPTTTPPTLTTARATSTTARATSTTVRATTTTVKPVVKGQSCSTPGAVAKTSTGLTLTCRVAPGSSTAQWS